MAGASCCPDENKTFLDNNKQRKIQILTIDSLIESGEIRIPEIAKFDIQEYELEALSRASILFGITELFILETSSFGFSSGNLVLSEVVSFMSDRGYEIYDFAGFFRRPYDGALAQIDVCFAKKNGFLRSSNNWA